ncbi:MAG: Do family serine endopeptidase [Mucilaginibacter polytrichastri]|nr:Do family serine endopeptidase [Mucilaginibacter polytrichastri]
MKKIGLTLLTAIVGGAVAVGAYKLFEKKNDGLTFEERQKVYFTGNRTAPVVSSAGTEDFTQAAAAVTPAVVYIRTTYTPKNANRGGGNDMQDMFEDFFGRRFRQQPQGPQRASGSGVIISPDGYIVTNNHVVKDADKIEITTNDKRTLQAKVIGTDPNTDLALIKVTSNTNLPIVKLGNSDDVRVGEWVLAVGNPFNLTSTVTAGIVSAKGRGLGIIGSGDDGGGEGNPFQQYQESPAAPRLNKGIESFIQTDAAINPGNSGGALVNTKGELVGINTAIASHTGSYEGYGFAIPINLAKKVLDDIEKYGKVQRGYVGVSFQELNSDAAEAFGVKETNGLYVNDVVKGGGAEAAGIRKGDIIKKVDGNNIFESSDLQEKVARLKPGDKVKLSVLRDGKEQTFNVTLKAEDTANKYAAAPSKSAEEVYNKLGASFVPLSGAEKQKIGVSSGVKVTQIRPGRLFDQTEIPSGSIITRINKQPVNNVADIEKAIGASRGMLIVSGITPDGVQFNNTFSLQ